MSYRHNTAVSSALQEIPSLEDCYAGNGTAGLPDDPDFYSPIDTGSECPLPEGRDEQVVKLASTFKIRIRYARKMRCWCAFVAKPSDLSTAYNCGTHKTPEDAREACIEKALQLASAEIAA